MRNYLIRGMTSDGGIRFFCCVSTQLVEEARVIHDCYPLSIAALGRMLTAASMMGTMLKSDYDKLTIQINGKGPAGSILVSTDYSGNVRGYIANPHTETRSKANGKLDVGWAVGVDGTLTVIKDFGLKEPYIGQVPIASGEIADDLTVYFANSEQTPTSVGLGILVEVDGHVSAAGGFIIQVMPEAGDEEITQIETNLTNMKQITELIKNEKTPEDVIKSILGDIEYIIQEKHEIAYVCNCERERIEKALISLGETELNDLIEEQGTAEIVCHFCNKKYLFDKEQLNELLHMAKS